MLKLNKYKIQKHVVIREKANYDKFETNKIE